MALLFIDGFDHYATAEIEQKYTQITVGPTHAPTIGAYGRRSTNGMRWNCTNSFPSRPVRKTTVPGNATAIIGFSVYWEGGFASIGTGLSDSVTSNNNGSGTSVGLLYLLQGGSTQLWFRVNTAGRIVAMRGSTELGTSSTGLTNLATSYVEFKALIHASAGTVDVRIDGASVLALTGIDTMETATAAWDEFAIGHVGGPSSLIVQIDDLYVADSTGSDVNDFTGDLRIDVCQPTADGAATSFTPSSGSDNFAMVDEDAADGDSTYNESSTVNHIDSFTTEDAPTSNPIIAVAVTMQARKTDAGSSTIAGLARIGGTDYPGTDQATPSSYAFHQQIWETSPATTAEWTEAEFNAAEFGYKKTA